MFALADQFSDDVDAVHWQAFDHHKRLGELKPCLFRCPRRNSLIPFTKACTSRSRTGRACHVTLTSC